MLPLYATITSSGKHGYRCTAHSKNLDRSLVSTLEKVALPFGNAWDRYIGARSIKVFPVDNRKMALSYTRVTEDKDDYARTGILVCQCIVVTLNQYALLMKQPAFGFDDLAYADPGALEQFFDEKIRERPEREPRLLDQASDASVVTPRNAKLRLLVGRPLVIKHSFEHANRWKLVENAIQTLVSEMPRYSQHRLSFATMTLSPADQMKIIAIPQM